MPSHQLPRTAAEVALARTQPQGSAGFKRKGEVPVDSAKVKERPLRTRYYFLLIFLFSVLVLAPVVFQMIWPFASPVKLSNLASISCLV